MNFKDLKVLALLEITVADNPLLAENLPKANRKSSVVRPAVHSRCIARVDAHVIRLGSHLRKSKTFPVEIPCKVSLIIFPVETCLHRNWSHLQL